MINGRQVIAIIGTGTFDLQAIARIESSRFIGLTVVASNDDLVIEQASTAGKVTRLIETAGSSKSDSDFVSAIVESEDDESFVEGDPYLVFINLDQCTASISDVEAGLLRLGTMSNDLTLVAAGLCMGSLSAFRIFGQFNGPNALPL